MEIKPKFDCNNDNTRGLRYDGFSIVYMQIFYVGDSNDFDKGKDLKCLEKHPLIKRDNDPIDQQIFVFAESVKEPVKRYELEGFDIKIDLDDPYEASICGHVHVEMSVFFKKTVSLTYRLVVDGSICNSTNLLCTDHLITLASLNMGAEHWSCDEEGSPSNINLNFKGICVSNIPINANGDPIENTDKNSFIENTQDAFKQVSERYKTFILKLTKTSKRKDRTSIIQDMNYVYVDIWESVKHHDSLFSELKEEHIISHIMEEHKREMVGLMTLYPAEWPYRTEESYEDVCGGNVAIDTDDLILVNQNICVVFGTYGLRGGKDSPTDWEEHLKERSHYHVSWPEYLLILEMVLAKKYTLAFANEVLLNSVLSDESFKNTQKAIEENATLNLNITKLLMSLDAVKYSKFMSHKIMFDRTRKRLNIDEDNDRLIAMMDKIDNSLNNIRDVRSLKQGTLLNIVLAGISVASLFQIIFMDLEIPFLNSLGFQSDRVGFGIIFITFFLIFIGLTTLFVFMVSNKRRK